MKETLRDYRLRLLREEREAVARRTKVAVWIGVADACVFAFAVACLIVLIARGAL